MCYSGVEKECYPHGVYFVSLVTIFQQFQCQCTECLVLTAVIDQCIYIHSVNQRTDSLSVYFAENKLFSLSYPN